MIDPSAVVIEIKARYQDLSGIAVAAQIIAARLAELAIGIALQRGAEAVGDGDNRGSPTC